MPSKKQYDRRLAQLKTERDSWLPHWQDLGEHFLPRRIDSLFGQDNKAKSGSKKNQKIVDATVRDAVKTNSAGMMSGLTSPARPWFRLVTPDPNMMEFADVREWLYIAEQRMRELFTKSNLYSILPTLYAELSVFGTSAMGAFEGRDGVPVFYGYPIGSYMIAQDFTGAIDTFYRELHMKVSQIVDKFGIENVSAKVKAAYNSGHVDQQFKIIHLIEPNDDRSPEKLDNLNMPFRSVWYEAGASENDAMLRVSGYEEFPVMVPRWETTAEDPYGQSSPGIDVLGTAKSLMIQTRRKAQAIDKLVDPPLQAPASLKREVISMMPGDITYYDEMQGAKGVRSLYDFRPDLQAMLLDVQDIRGMVQRMFFTDLFRMISDTAGQQSQRTAHEVAQLHEEKLLLLGPVLENLNKGLLKPLIDRTFLMMLRNNQLPPPPPQLAGVDLKVEYISMLAQAQRQTGLGAIERGLGFAAQVADLGGPQAVDKVNFDQSIDEYFEALGAPPTLIRTDEDVQALRQRRAQQQRAQQIVENAGQIGKGAKDLSETDMDADSALRRLAEARAQ